MTRVLRRWLEARSFPLLAALVAFGLVSPALSSGWFLDDLWHRAGFTRARELSEYLGTAGDFSAPMRMYAFWDGDHERTWRLMDRGIIPWWSDPSLRIAFWRPLAALTHALDYRLWPERATWMHLHSGLWLALLVIVAGLAYRRLLAVAWASGLATLLFAVSASHALPTAWLANRHALVGGAVGVGALLAHVRWRKTLRASWALVAWVAFALSLLASEGAVAVVAYMCSYALVLEGGSWRRRLGPLLPYAVIATLWRAVYHGLGYGVVGSALYVDPGTDPWRFAQVVLDRAPLLAVSLLGVPAADASLLLSPIASHLLACGAALVLLILVWLAHPVWKDSPPCRFLAMGAFLAVVPLCSAMPGNRNLGFAAFGAAGLVAQLAVNTDDRRAAPDASGRSAAARKALLAVLALLLGFAPLSVLASASAVKRLGPGIARLVDIGPPGRGGTGREIVFVSTPCSLGIFFLVPDRLLRGFAPPDHVLVLSPGTGSVEVERLGDRVLVVRPHGGYCLPPGASVDGSPSPLVGFDNVLRRADGFLCGQDGGPRLGTVVALSSVSVRVSRATIDGRAAEARFELASSLEDPVRRWLRWNAAHGVYEDWTPPAVVGERVTLD